MHSKIFKIISIITAIIIFLFSLSSVTLAEETPVTRILFLGNSLTFYNHMPSLLETAGLKSGINVDVDSITQGNATVAQFAYQASLRTQVDEALNTNTYDYVVIQPTRKISPDDYAQSHLENNEENTVYNAEKQAAIELNALFNSYGATTLLYATPGLNNFYQFDIYKMDEGSSYATSIVYDENGTALTYSMPRTQHSEFSKTICYEFAEDMSNVAVVNCGDVFEKSISENSLFNLYNSDNRHPNVNGSYLIAYSFYAYIFGVSPVGVGYDGTVAATKIIFFQRIAAIYMLGESKDILNSETASQNITTLKQTSINGVNLKWSESGNNVTDYRIYRRELDGTYSYIATTSVKNYNDSNIEKGKTYYYKIRACYKIGDISFIPSIYSTASKISTLGDTTLLSVELKNKTTSVISYEPASSAYAYRISRKVLNGTWSRIGTSKTTTFTDSKMEKGKTYFYRVRAFIKSDNVNIYSSFSSNDSVTALEAPKVVLAMKKTTLKITYPLVKGANKYIVYLKKGAKGTYNKLGVFTKNSLTVKGLSSGKKYYVLVRSVATVNEKTYKSRLRKAVSIQVK